jgi:hypothetical protein
MNRTVGACFAGCSIAAMGCTERLTPDRPEDAAMAPRDMGHDAPIVDFGPPPDNVCVAIPVPLTRIIPRVMVVIDQSGSMIQDFGGQTRWHALEDALVGTDGLVTNLSAHVRFGAVMYTDGPDDPACPELQTTVVMLPGLSAIRSLYGMNGPEGNTPTGAAIASVLSNRASLFDEAGSTGPEIIILATDGEPGLCDPEGTGAGGDIVGGRVLTLSSTRQAHDAGIDTYVISVGTEVANMHLQDVANAGVGHVAGTPDAPFWVATDTSMLRDALATIASSALPCTLELSQSVIVDRVCEGTLKLGTTQFTCGTDWHAADETHITLSPTACDQLRHSADDLIVTFPCDALIF